MNLLIIESPRISKTISITMYVLYYLRYLALPYLIESLYSIEMYKNIGIERVNTFFSNAPFIYTLSLLPGGFIKFANTFWTYKGIRYHILAVKGRNKFIPYFKVLCFFLSVMFAVDSWNLLL